MAEETGVTLLVETNGVFADTARLCRLMDRQQAMLWECSGIPTILTGLWGETPEQTVQNLGAYIKYVHIKDSVVEDGKIQYRLMGEGDLPVDQIMLALDSINYDGYISLEWVKRWASELSDAGVVFPHFANFMRRYIKGTPARGCLTTGRQEDISGKRTS